MTTLSIKIVGIEGDSVLVKYASDNSAKPIDEYDPIAYQPKTMGYTNLDDFIAGIKPGLLIEVANRDRIESAPAELDLSSWEGHESNHSQEDDPNYIPPPTDSQIVVKNSEVVL